MPILKRKLTQADCNLWYKNKNINPITNRKINTESNIYKLLKINCEKSSNIVKNVNEFCEFNYKDESDDKKYRKLYEYVKIFCDKFYASLRPQKTINTNLTNYKIIIDYLKKIKLNNNECLTLYKSSNKYLLSDNILLYKKIGSNSRFGVVFKSMNINTEYENIPKFVVKIQFLTKEYKTELLFFKLISDYAVKYNIPNLPVLYKSINCDKIIREPAYPEVIYKSNRKFKKYSMILYELASGDLKSYLTMYNITEQKWKNIYEQIFMSILILHSMNIIHNDTHYGNFLYTKIKPGGCFHYKINGDDYYIENIGYRWIIWDFGNARPLSKLVNGLFINDYMLINLFMRKRNLTMEKLPEFKNHNIYGNGRYAGYLDNDVIIPKSIEKLQEKLWKHLGELTNNYYISIIHNKKLTEYKWFKYLIENNMLYSRVPIGSIISSVKINIS